VLQGDHELHRQEWAETVRYLPRAARQMPDYYHNIVSPIALSHLRKHINSHQYKTVMAYRDDMRLVFTNARTYNQVSASTGIQRFEIPFVHFCFTLTPTPMATIRHLSASARLQFRHSSRQRQRRKPSAHAHARLRTHMPPSYSSRICAPVRASLTSHCYPHCTCTGHPGPTVLTTATHMSLVDSLQWTQI
jgi:hypothetical protein